MTTLTHIDFFREYEEHERRIGWARRQVNCNRQSGSVERDTHFDFNLAPSLHQDYEAFKVWFDDVTRQLSAYHMEREGLLLLMTHHKPNVRSILFPEHPEREDGVLILRALVISFVEQGPNDVEVRQCEVERIMRHGQIIDEFTTPDEPVGQGTQAEVLRLPIAA